MLFVHLTFFFDCTSKCTCWSLQHLQKSRPHLAWAVAVSLFVFLADCLENAQQHILSYSILPNKIRLQKIIFQKKWSWVPVGKIWGAKSFFRSSFSQTQFARMHFSRKKLGFRLDWPIFFSGGMYSGKCFWENLVLSFSVKYSSSAKYSSYSLEEYELKRWINNINHFIESPPQITFILPRVALLILAKGR